MAEYVGSRDRAKQFRTMLKQSFPGVRFYVRCDRGTAWSWITVRWEDGPTREEVGDMLRPLHEELTLEREYSVDTKIEAANILAAHYPEWEVFDRHDGSINWNLETYKEDVKIGPKHVRSQTMHSTISEIAEHYVLGGVEQFSNAAERKAKQAAFLAEREAQKAQESITADEAPELDIEGDDMRHSENALPAEDEGPQRGRLVRSNAFVLGMHPGEKPHLDVKRVWPFEATLRAVEDPDEPDEEDLTPRSITFRSPANRPLEIHAVPALVMADTDGYRAGEVVWLGQVIAQALERVERVLVGRGEGMPLLPITSSLITLL